ncbi:MULTISPECIES: hypothetical protein [unclassified Pseudomonas]|uniref:hypothetical protein n=1 Tax=unclassified Pseudomonas TaxID=196821 RepID=UPI002032EA7D|nr:MULTISPECIES: hypothetical protein [unclassified Pseudomonas]
MRHLVQRLALELIQAGLFQTGDAQGCVQRIAEPGPMAAGRVCAEGGLAPILAQRLGEGAFQVGPQGAYGQFHRWHIQEARVKTIVVDDFEEPEVSGIHPFAGLAIAISEIQVGARGQVVKGQVEQRRQYVLQGSALGGDGQRSRGDIDIQGGVLALECIGQHFCDHRT